MTITVWEMTLYAGALLILFLTPGPVWLAMLARSVSGGFSAAWPLALGVSVGDAIWPLAAILGVSWMVTEVSGLMDILRWVACAVFLWMGWVQIRNAGDKISANTRLTRPGRMAGFAAGVAAILGNPKAILFYMGVLPGFFDMSTLTKPDIAAILALSVIIPLIGNLALALFIDRMRRFLSSPTALRRTNLIAGWLLICVGLVIPLT